MEILGFQRVNDGKPAARAWQQEVERAASSGMTLTTLEVIGSRTDESTGEFEFDIVEVRDAETTELLERFTADEFRSVKYDHKGWFDANGPYVPQG